MYLNKEITLNQFFFLTRNFLTFLININLKNMCNFGIFNNYIIKIHSDYLSCYFTRSPLPTVFS